MPLLRWIPLALGVVVLIEVLLRVTGLTERLVMRLDSEVEYMPEPRYYCRMHWRGARTCILINSVHMHAAEILSEKQSPRVVVIGNFIVFGYGWSLDQSQIATECPSKAPWTWVLNIFAGSWGASNQVAHICRYGLFDADIAIIVMSTHDLTDVLYSSTSYTFATERHFLFTYSLLMYLLGHFLPGQIAARPSHATQEIKSLGR